MSAAGLTERPHGYARYRLDGCRCYVCGWAVSEYDRKRNEGIAAGTWQPYVDAAPVRAHLAVLSAAGIGYKRAARLAGVSPSTVGGLLYSRTPNPQVRPHIAEALLAVLPGMPTLAPGSTVDATGTRRRIGALAAIGWTLTEQAREIGWSISNLSGLLAAGRVEAGTTRAVAAMYDRWSMRPPADGYGSGRARLWAARRGFPPPLAWDDETIDDPAAVPAGVVPRDPGELDPVRVRYLCAGKPVGELTIAERHAAARALVAAGHTVKATARRVHLARETINRLRDAGRQS